VPTRAAHWDPGPGFGIKAFAGREWDNETGPYYYRARYYDPKIGRFISEDPIGLDGGVNFYEYVGSNPINRRDPSGQRWPDYIWTPGRKPFASTATVVSWHLEAFHHAFGDPIDIALWHANDPLALALSADPTGAPALSFDCGESDRYGLFAGASELHRRLTARGVPHSFALLPGDHGYEYVRSVLPGSLRFLGAALGGAPKKAP
jgi:RHS repeat-associated protein